MELSSCPDCHDLADALRKQTDRITERDEIIKQLRFLLKGTELSLKQARKQIDLQNKYIEKLGFCPDCRDKTDGTCFRCKVQYLEKRLERYNEKAENF